MPRGGKFTTRVNAVFHDGRYEIEVVTDGPSLEEKLAGIQSKTGELLIAGVARVAVFDEYRPDFLFEQLEVVRRAGRSGQQGSGKGHRKHAVQNPAGM